jgi:hypothetical protein
MLFTTGIGATLGALVETRWLTDSIPQARTTEPVVQQRVRKFLADSDESSAGAPS